MGGNDKPGETPHRKAVRRMVLGIDERINGVNLGNWLVLEKWMDPEPFEPGPGSGLIVLRYNLFILILFQSAIRFLHDYAPSERHIFLHGENKGIPASRRIPLSNVSNKP